MVARLFLVLLIFVLTIMVMAWLRDPGEPNLDDPPAAIYRPISPPPPGHPPIQKTDRLMPQALTPQAGWQPTALEAGKSGRDFFPVPLPPRRPPSSAEIAATCARRGLHVWVRIDGERYECTGG